MGQFLKLLRKDWWNSYELLADGVLPALILDFEKQRYAANKAPFAFSDRITFTRSSTGTYEDAGGLIQTAAIDAPRFDYSTGRRGFLIEGARTNEVPYAYDPNQWSATSATITDTGDDVGIFNKVAVASTGAVWNRANALSSFTWDTTKTYAVRFYYIVGTSGRVRITCRNSTAANETQITGTPGSLATTLSDAGTVSGLTERDHGPYRSVSFLFVPAANSSNTSFAIGPDSSTSGENIYSLGAQVEEGSFHTSLIPSNGTATTRAADVAQITGTAFSDWFNASAGTLFADFQQFGPATTGSFGSIANISDGTSNESIELRQPYGPARYRLQVVDGGVDQVEINNNESNTTANKIAGAYAENDFAFTVNGEAVITDSSGTLPTVDQMTLGENKLNGHMFNFTYYNTRLSNATLQELTGN